MRKQRGKTQSIPTNLDLMDVSPMNKNQEILLKSNNNLVCNGCAGTGKTFLSSYKAYRDILELGLYNKLIYMRSAVPSRNLGFLPGNEAEKTKVYETPYMDIATELFDRGDAYSILKTKGAVEFMTTSFIRGRTITDSVFIIDECQNMTFQELDSIITRVGKGCKLYFCGDYYQSDLKDTGILPFFKILRTMHEFDFIEFTVDDIVRSGIVKNYLTNKDKINESHPQSSNLSRDN